MFDRELAVGQLDQFWEGLEVSVADILGKRETMVVQVGR
jgi:hypothetical protein